MNRYDALLLPTSRANPQGETAVTLYKAGTTEVVLDTRLPINRTRYACRNCEGTVLFPTRNEAEQFLRDSIPPSHLSMLCPDTGARMPADHEPRSIGPRPGHA